LCHSLNPTHLVSFQDESAHQQASNQDFQYAFLDSVYCTAGDPPSEPCSSSFSS
jgi:hypothetical protein